MPYRLVVALMLLTGPVVLLGCHDSALQRQMARRRQSIETTARKLAYREQVAGQRLRRDAAFVGRDVRRDVKELGRDVRALQAYLEFDLRRFQQRQKGYGKTLLEIFGGAPENIEPTAVIMFF